MFASAALVVKPFLVVIISIKYIRSSVVVVVARQQTAVVVGRGIKWFIYL
jgi:hypothetical protein